VALAKCVDRHAQSSTVVSARNDGQIEQRVSDTSHRRCYNDSAGRPRGYDPRCVPDCISVFESGAAEFVYDD
jgi:hypothetical protein